MNLNFFIVKMFPVQVLVVLSTMIIINQSATLNYENQTSATTSYGVDKETYKMLSNKINYNLNDVSKILPSYGLNKIDSYGHIINSNVTGLPVLKRFSLLELLPAVISTVEDIEDKILDI